MVKAGKFCISLCHQPPGFVRLLLWGWSSGGASSGCLLGAGLAVWADDVDGSGCRTKNWRGVVTHHKDAGGRAADNL